MDSIDALNPSIRGGSAPHSDINGGFDMSNGSAIDQSILAKQRDYSNNNFSDILSGALDMAANVVAPGLGTIDNFSSLMQQQMLWQIEMQYYTAESNISKSKHEVAMAPIRNLRVG